MKERMICFKPVSAMNGCGTHRHTHTLGCYWEVGEPKAGTPGLRADLGHRVPPIFRSPALLAAKTQAETKRGRQQW